MTALLAGIADVIQLAHETQLPHEEPMSSGSGGGASTIVIIVGVALTLALVGALVWLKKRVDG